MESYIGIFDSGAGGLTVLRAMERILPGENYLYFGDTARLPYGPRPLKEVEGFVLEIGDYLVASGCKIILIACNTATAAGLAALREKSPVPVYGMIDAACRGLEELAGSGANPWPAGLAATEGTVGSGAYQEAVKRLAERLKPAVSEAAPGVQSQNGDPAGLPSPFGKLLAKGCPRFVTLVEQGITEGEKAAEIVGQDLKELKEESIRSLILGCTHFPFLAGEISRFLGPETVLIDPAVSLSRMVKEKLEQEGLLTRCSAEKAGKRLFYCSGEPKEFQRVGGRLLGRPLDQVRRKIF